MCSPRGDIAALHDDHVAAVAAATPEVATACGAGRHRRDDLEERVAYWHEEIVKPKTSNAGVTVTDFESEDAPQVRLDHVQIFRDEANLPHPQHGAPLSDCWPQRPG
ncbi:MAG: hypothetical protein F4Y11_05640 [Chloroflexi bacterium]|nr:hypothetical protein [Chloroflexota bacterium]